MKRFKFHLIFFIPVISLLACSNHKYQTIDGTPLEMNKGIVRFYFILKDCPVSRGFQGHWKEEAYGDITTYFVFPGVSSYEEIKSVAEYDSLAKNMIVLDADYSLTKELGAEVTPQVTLLKDGEIKYEGMIDNRFKSIVSLRQKPDSNFVHNALNSLLNGEEPNPKYRKPVGCLISRSR